MWTILRFVRENPDKLKWSQKARGLPVDIVDRAVELDRLWRMKLTELNEIRHRRNELSRNISRADRKERENLIGVAKNLSAEIEKLENEVAEIREKLDAVLLSIPNVVHEKTPVGKDENDNIPLKYWGRPRVMSGHLESFLKETDGFEVEYEVVDVEIIPHADISELSGFVDTGRAGKVSGSRFYYLLDDLVWIDFALMMYAMDFISSKGFRIVMPPYMLRRRAYEGVTAFSDFEDMIYKIEEEDLFLIATSEHPIAAMHMNETIPQDELPYLYAGVSPCFRKEAGSHGKDTKGIFRVHQFNKVEQFIFCLPEESWNWHLELLKNVEEIWQGLGLPYRIVDICTGDLGDVAARKYDLEVWMPAQGKYREMVSCSNCTDYQSYRLNIRYSEEKGKPSKGFVHTLNSTAIASTRAITAIMENYQREDGVIEIPDVLRKYLEPFSRAPKEEIQGVRK